VPDGELDGYKIVTDFSTPHLLLLKNLGSPHSNDPGIFFGVIRVMERAKVYGAMESRINCQS
jgi:hypothetical protein